MTMNSRPLSSSLVYRCSFTIPHSFSFNLSIKLHLLKSLKKQCDDNQIGGGENSAAGGVGVGQGGEE